MTTLATIEGLRAALLDAAVEVQALSNRLLHVSPRHREHAKAVRTQARELSKVLEGMEPSAAELETPKVFFPKPGSKATGFMHLEGDG